MRLPCFDIAGTPYEMGLTLGRNAQRLIRPSVLFYRKHWRAMVEPKMGWHESVKRLRASAALLKRRLPKTFEELRGIADGAKIPFSDIFTINSMEALHQFRREKCTSFIARTRAGILLAHNEDWMWGDRAWLYLVRARPKGEPAILAMTYGPWTGWYGVTRARLAYAADSQTATDAQTGIAQTFVGREILRARSLPDAIRRITSLPRADGHTYVIASPSRGVLVETTATRAHITPVHRAAVHTNFYQSSLAAHEREPRTYSRFRAYRVKELLKHHRGAFTDRALFRILADHQNYPESVCNHTAEAARKKTGTQTITSLILNPRAGTASIIPSNPCHGRPQTVRLR